MSRRRMTASTSTYLSTTCLQWDCIEEEKGGGKRERERENVFYEHHSHHTLLHTETAVWCLL